MFFSFYFTVRAIMWMWCLETQVPLHEQGACCEQRPAALKHRSPVQPDSQLGSALPCQATPQPAGGNLQLQHLSRINSSASTLKASRCTRERCKGSPVSVDNVWLMSEEWTAVLLSYCSHVVFMWKLEICTEQWSHLLHWSSSLSVQQIS